MSKSQIVHLGLAIFWILMIGPTLTIWHNSILLVLLMSLFANVEASITAFLSAKPKPKRKRVELRTTNMSHGKGSMHVGQGSLRLVRAGRDRNVLR
jgi:hypothetical protein